MREGSRRRIARLFARLAKKQIAPPSTAPKGLHEKCPAAALRASSNRASVRPSSRALHLSTFRANAAPSGFRISLLVKRACLLCQRVSFGDDVSAFRRNKLESVGRKLGITLD